jgi:formate dehydrogenase maturation protein FdhE
MSGSPVDEQKHSARLHQKLQLAEAIRRGQEPLWDVPLRGLKPSLEGEASIKEKQKEGFNQSLPVSYLLDEDDYDVQSLTRALMTLVYEVHELEIDTEADPVELVNRLGDLLPELIGHVLKSDHGYFESLSGRLGVSSLALSMVGGALLQPSMIYIASNSDREYLDAWDIKICPICGRMPSVVKKAESDVWRYKCTYCLAEYRMDIFRCPHCGSEGTESKEFLLVGDAKAYEIASCLKCRHYYKIINTNRLDEQIPEGLEDAYTEQLDEVAHQRGLTRLDEASQEGQ